MEVPAERKEQEPWGFTVQGPPVYVGICVGKWASLEEEALGGLGKDFRPQR